MYKGVTSFEGLWYYVHMISVQRGLCAWQRDTVHDWKHVPEGVSPEGSLSRWMSNRETKNGNRQASYASPLESISCFKQNWCSFCAKIMSNNRLDPRVLAHFVGETPGSATDIKLCKHVNHKMFLGGKIKERVPYVKVTVVSLKRKALRKLDLVNAEILCSYLLPPATVIFTTNKNCHDCVSVYKTVCTHKILSVCQGHMRKNDQFTYHQLVKYFIWWLKGRIKEGQFQKCKSLVSRHGKSFHYLSVPVHFRWGVSYFNMVILCMSLYVRRVRSWSQGSLWVYSPGEGVGMVPGSCPGGMGVSKGWVGMSKGVGISKGHTHLVLTPSGGHQNTLASGAVRILIGMLS